MSLSRVCTSKIKVQIRVDAVTMARPVNVFEKKKKQYSGKSFVVSILLFVRHIHWKKTSLKKKKITRRLLYIAYRKVGAYDEQLLSNRIEILLDLQHSLLSAINRREMVWFGHVVRRKSLWNLPSRGDGDACYNTNNVLITSRIG